MAIDPQISLGIRPQQPVALPQIQTPLDRYQRVLTLRHLMDQQQYEQLRAQQLQQEMEAARQAQQREQAFMESFRNPQPETVAPAGIPAPVAPSIGRGTGGAPYTPVTPQASAAAAPEGFFPATPPPPAPPRLPSTAQTLGMLGTKGIPVVKAFAELETERRKAEVERLKGERDKWAAFGSLAGTAKDEKTKNTAVGVALSRGLITPEQARAEFAQPYDAGRYEQFRISAIEAKDQADDALKRIQIPGAVSESFRKKVGMLASIGSAKLARSPDEYAKWIATLTPEEQAVFQGAASPLDVQKRAQTPHEYVTAEEQARHAKALEDYQSKGLTQTQSNQKANQESQLRQDYLQVFRPFQQVSDMYGALKSAKTSDDPFKDLTYVFSFMKMLEPTSAVMRGEALDVETRRALPDWVANLYDNVTKGNRLNPEQRAQIEQAAERMYKQRTADYAQRAEGFRQTAVRQGLTPENVIINFATTEPPKPPKPQSLVEGVVNQANAPAAAQTPTNNAWMQSAPPGKIAVIDPDGNPSYVDADKWEAAQKRGFRKP